MGSELPVLVGYFSDRVPDDDQTGAESLSKFGGRPVWIDGKAPEDYPFSCRNCGSKLSFVCQVATPYCANKRCLYLFGCHEQQDCSKSPLGWKVVRGVAESEILDCAYSLNYVVEEQCKGGDMQHEQTADPSDWLQAAFGSMTIKNRTSEKASHSRKPKACQPLATPSPMPSLMSSTKHACELLPPFFVHVEDEPPDYSCDDSTGKRARELQLQYEQREREGSAEDLEGNQSCSLETEEYEESPDKIFLKLQKRLARSPSQVIRYSFGGKPLFISPFSKEDEAKVGPCPLCGSVRVFEMQLVPAAADEIQKRRYLRGGETPIEWGVVVVFTCKEDCVPANKYTFEQAAVQEIL